MKCKMKIDVRNEDWPPGCLSQRLKIGTRPCCGDRYCFPIYPPGCRYPGKTLVREIPGEVNVFVGEGNGLPTALPYVSPRLKILMAPHWCCRVTSRAGYPGGRYPGKTLVFEKLGVKVQGVLVKSKMKIEVRNEDWRRGAYPRGLRLGCDPVVVIGIVAPFAPRESISRENSCSRDPGGGG